jgi:peptidyl-prolyl cis-trans isomerase SurA
MKKIAFTLLSLILFSSIFTQNNPVLITVEGEEIRKNEFLYNYTKNNPEVQFDKASLDQYTEMFVKFKLKVADAKAKGLDTIPRLKNELKGYVTKSAEKYLIDSSSTEELKREAYERKKWEIKASHILVDGTNAFDEIKRIKEEITKGKISFEEAATKYSKDPSASGSKGDLGYQGNLGYFSVFQMVYPFEEAAYNTKVGEISEPVKTKFGYHLIKVTDKRKNQGKIKVAHIYVKSPEANTEKENSKSKAKIDEIYNLLMNGNKSFEDLAKEYSDDNTSSEKGGELQWFTSGRMVPEFEKVAFSIESNGDVSEPFQTSYGWHIVRKLDQEPIGEYTELLPEIEQNLTRGDRSKKSKEYFVNKLKKEYKYKDESSKWISGSFDSELIGKLNADDSKTAFRYKKEKGLFKPKTNVTVSEFRKYLTTILPTSQQDIKFLYSEFVNNYFYNFEIEQLPTKYPEYGSLVKEFEDGILLFEISDSEVWAKSSEDTAGLEAFFETQKNKYIWKERIDAEIYTSSKKDITFEAIELAKDTNNSAEKILTEGNKDSQLNLSVKKGVFEVSGDDLINQFEIKEGVTLPKVIDGKFVFIRVFKIIEPQPKTLNDVRGTVISDYQKYLEAEWVSYLKEKYSVEINNQAIYDLKNKR